MTEFLTKNADVALAEVKEQLYERVADLQGYHANILDDVINNEFEAGEQEGKLEQIKDELCFLLNFLDKFERS